MNGIVVRIGLVAGRARYPRAERPRRAGFAPRHGRGATFWLQAIEVLLLADLGFYLAHRAFHAVPALWRLHQIHHSIEEMDWLAAPASTRSTRSSPRALRSCPASRSASRNGRSRASRSLYHWHSLLLHSNVRLGFGPLERLIASPDFHHWHHAREREAWDRNFAGQLALWDFVFGTAHLPDGRQAQSFGVADPVPSGYAAQLLHPFRRRG